jgi:hypothetical protein
VCLYVRACMRSCVRALSLTHTPHPSTNTRTHTRSRWAAAAAACRGAVRPRAHSFCGGGQRGCGWCGERLGIIISISSRRRRRGWYGEWVGCIITISSSIHIRRTTTSVACGIVATAHCVGPSHRRRRRRRRAANSAGLTHGRSGRRGCVAAAAAPRCYGWLRTRRWWRARQRQRQGGRTRRCHHPERSGGGSQGLV